MCRDHTWGGWCTATDARTLGLTATGPMTEVRDGAFLQRCGRRGRHGGGAGPADGAGRGWSDGSRSDVRDERESCSRAWGSTAERAGSLSGAVLMDVRTERHTCFDRVVLDLRGSGTGYRVSYVDSVSAQGSGKAVPLRGGAYLQVDLLHPAYDASGRATYAPADRQELATVAGYRTLRQLAWGGSVEGQTRVGVGVRARLPFRVLVLTTSTGSEVVLDVAHRW